MLKAYWNQEPLYMEVTQDDDDESSTLVPVEELDRSENENGYHVQSELHHTFTTCIHISQIKLQLTITANNIIAILQVQTMVAVGTSITHQITSYSPIYI